MAGEGKITSVDQPTGRTGAVAWRSRAAVLLDQGFSSVSNVLAVVLIARTLDAGSFGRFALAYSLLVVFLGLSRAWFGTRLSLVLEPSTAVAEGRRVLGALVILAPLLVIIVLACGYLLTGRGDMILLVVALATPIVCMQDALRFAAVAAGRQGAALVSDLAWTVALVALVPIGGRLTSSAILALWLAAAVVALLIIAGALRARPELGGGWAVLRSRHRTAESISFGTLVTQGASLVVISVVSAVISLTAVGSMRGASTLLGPLNVLIAFVSIALTPMLVRRRRPGDLRFCSAVAATMLFLVAVWGLVVLTMPDRWGEALLKDSWQGARSVLPFAVLEYCALGVGTAWVLGLKVRHEAGGLFRQKLIVAVAMVAAGCAAAAWSGDVRMVSAGLAVAAGIGALLGWHNLFSSARRGAPAVQEVSAPVAG
jgi:O-antigen/teichoic acid export membrane protein